MNIFKNGVISSIKYYLLFCLYVLEQLRVFLFQIPCPLTDGEYQEKFQRAHPLLARLGIVRMPDRQLCLGKKLLTGLVLPKNERMQSKAIGHVVAWYLPCINFTKSRSIKETYDYSVNQFCFLRREKMLLKLFSKFPQYPKQESLLAYII